jgi:tripartite-type tricarboxylate transporter receptor subunit TctC
MRIPHFAASSVLSALLTLAASGVSGQEYPTKPIRIVTLGAGGGSDITTRIVAQGISVPLGQQVIVDNRTPIQAPETVAKSPPDGYTLLITGGSLFTLPLLQKTPFQMSDFAPITMVDRATNMLAVHASLPVNSLKEFIAFAKARPGELNFASTGVGTGSHLAGELLKALAGISLVHVPFKGTAPALASLVGGEVELCIIDASALAPLVKSGKLKALAVSSPQPSALYPGLPTMAATLPGYESVGMTVMFAPVKTPDAIITRLNTEVVRFATRPETKEKFLSMGTEAVGYSLGEFQAFIKAEIARWSKVIKEANVKLD